MKNLWTLTVLLMAMLSMCLVSCGDDETPEPMDDGDDTPPVYTIKKVPYSVKGITFNMMKVDGGTFGMGSNMAYSDEAPWHLVTLSDYYISETEVTQELYKAVMGTTQSYFSGNKRPVDYCSWDLACAFIVKLNVLTGKNFRLPTEAEWEYAAKGGRLSAGYNNHRYYKYSGSNNIDEVAWHKTNSSEETHDVATKAPNELGIYDMSGNVDEWCSDWFGSYSEEAVTNPKGATSGPGHVRRGGSWWNVETYLRNTYRDYLTSSSDVNGAMYGIRLCLSDSE